MLNNAVAVFSAPVPPVTNSYESIATVTVGSGGASSVTFSSIPSTYKHLQVRMLSQTNRGTYGFDDIKYRINGDSGANYTRHLVGGNGSSGYVYAATGQTYANMDAAAGTVAGSSFGVGIIDFLDYSNTNKNKTQRALVGVDLNGTVGGLGGRITFNSNLWLSTSAISSLVFYGDGGGTISQNSVFALYGIKG